MKPAVIIKMLLQYNPDFSKCICIPGLLICLITELSVLWLYLIEMAGLPSLTLTYYPFNYKGINFKFCLQPHQKYYIMQYEELGFSSLSQMKDDYTTNLHCLIYRFLFEKLE